MKKLINADRDLTKGYRYITNHGMGPGTVPDDVHILHWEDLPNYKTAFWTDRFLTTDELKYYDVKEAPVMSSINYTKGYMEFRTSEQQFTMKSPSGNNYRVKISLNPNLIGIPIHRLSIVPIKPYDDAEYCWVRYRGDRGGNFGRAMVLRDCRDGSQDFIDWITLFQYEPDEYDNIVKYAEDIVYTLAEDLDDINSDIEPIMVHN